MPLSKAVNRCQGAGEASLIIPDKYTAVLIYFRDRRTNLNKRVLDTLAEYKIEQVVLVKLNPINNSTRFG